MFKKEMKRLSKGKVAHIRAYFQGSTVVTKQDI